MTVRAFATTNFITTIIVLSACSAAASFSIGGQTVESAAEDLIAQELADQLELGELTPACPDVENPQVGTEFTCTAQTSDGLTINFAGVVDREDHIEVETTNVSSGPLLAQALYEVLEQENAVTGTQPDQIDCGPGSIVLTDLEVVCEINFDGGEMGEAVLAITDVNNSEFTYTYTPPDLPSSDEQAAVQDPLQALADAALIQLDDLGDGWDESPREKTEERFEDVEGCAHIGDMVNNDGFVVEAASGEFTSDEVSLHQAVRVYSDTETASGVVLAWAEQTTAECIVKHGELIAETALNAGELAPYEQVGFELQVYEDHVGEPRISNLELTSTLTAPGHQVILIDDIYYIQVDHLVSVVSVTSNDAIWEQTADLVNVVAELMADAAADY